MTQKLCNICIRASLRHVYYVTKAVQAVVGTTIMRPSGHLTLCQVLSGGRQRQIFCASRVRPTVFAVSFTPAVWYSCRMGHCTFKVDLRPKGLRLQLGHHVQLGLSAHIALSEPMTYIDRQGSSLESGLASSSLNPHYNPTSGHLILFQVLSGGVGGKDKYSVPRGLGRLY